jgi:serine/threonine protein kinase
MFDQCGNANYRAPETFGCTGYNESVDLWSVGVVAFNILSGKHPFSS